MNYGTFFTRSVAYSVGYEGYFSGKHAHDKLRRLPKNIRSNKIIVIFLHTRKQKKSVRTQHAANHSALRQQRQKTS